MNTTKPLGVGQIANFLSKTSLLKELPSDKLELLGGLVKVGQYKKGKIIFKLNDPAMFIHFIYSGYVAELVAYGSSVDVIVNMRKPFDYIGEMGILSGGLCPNTAVAVEDLTLISLSKADFINLCQENYSVTSCIIKELIKRLTGSGKSLVTAMYLDAPAKLAFTIVKLVTVCEDSSGLNITQNDLASSAGIARQTAAKIICEWRELGYIVTKRGKFIVKSLDSLVDIIVKSELR